MIMSIVSLKAQSDGFFNYRDEYSRESNDEWCEFVLLPQHGVSYNYPADDVPITAGVLLLVEMVLIYGVIKKYKNTDS